MEDLLFEALSNLLDYHDKQSPKNKVTFEAAEVLHARFVLHRAKSERKKRATK